MNKNDETITEASLLAQLAQARRERDEIRAMLKAIDDVIMAAWKPMLTYVDPVQAITVIIRERDEAESQIAERAAALCQSCPLLNGSADLLGVINALRLQRLEVQEVGELHKRAAVTLGKFYLSTQTRQALDDLRTCKFENGGS